MVSAHLALSQRLITLVKQLYDNSSTVCIATDVQEQRCIVIECLHLDTLLVGFASHTIDINDGGTIDLKAILRSWSPVDQ